MIRVLLVSVQSRRPLSCRQSTGVGTACVQLLQPELGASAGEAGAAEVAVALGLGRHEGAADAAAVVLVDLLREEEVQLVLDDRAAQSAAEVVPLERRLLLAGLLQEIVGGVERVAPC